MAFESNVGGKDRLTRAVLAVVFALVTLKAVRSGKRLRGLIAGTVAIGLALNVVTCFCNVNRVLGIDTTNSE